MNKATINIWGDWHSSRDIKPNILENLIKLWIHKYKNIEFNIKHYKPIRDPDLYKETISKLAPSEKKYITKNRSDCFTFFIENQETKKYLLISWWDRASDVIHNFSHFDYHENCVEFFTAQGCHNPKKTLTPAVDYITKETLKYTPLNKIPWGIETGKEIDRLMSGPKLNQVIPEKLHIRMFKTGYGFRTYLINDKRFTTYTGAKTKPEVHVRELSLNKINMEVYSVSGPSMRLIEGMGLGSAVLSTTFPQKTHDEIVPDFHFVKVPFDYDHLPLLPNYNNSGKVEDPGLCKIFKELADNYIEVFESLKKDKERIDFISKNAREYYLNHCTRDKYLKHLEQMLDLNKIL